MKEPLMPPIKKLFAISAVVFLVIGVALALAMIAGIWLGFESGVVAKVIGTLFVLFILSGVLHVVVKGMCETPKDKP
ncbi:MAG: hypothetical protein KDN18_22260 [Verrucomicrobiae bacterium]|nr:hypothetical protein [Verrucomicrobiae bacterium]